MLKLINERWIAIRSNEFELDVWNYHLQNEFPPINDLCSKQLDWMEVRNSQELDFTRTCLDWEYDKEGYIYNTCASGKETYDCNVLTRTNVDGGRPGVLNQTLGDDFYARGEWAFDDPLEEARYNDQ
jgi:hypothetical protein